MGERGGAGGGGKENPRRFGAWLTLTSLMSRNSANYVGQAGSRLAACPISIVIWLALGAVALGQKPSPAIASKASLDFEKVEAAAIPSLPDTMACVQSNAAAVASARFEERYLPYYRKGYCELFSALVTRDSATFQRAARDFTEAIANWPKKMIPRPPAGLRALVAVARIEQGRMADSYPDMPRDHLL